MADIYDNSWKQRLIVRPIGYLAARATALIGRNLETSKDVYKRCYLTAAELVERDRLPPTQQLMLQSSERLATGPLYKATMAVYYPIQNNVRMREFFIPQDMLQQILRMGSIKKMPTLKNPVGNGTSVLGDSAWDVETKGQFWGYMRPRIETITQKASDAEDVNEILQQPNKVSCSPVAKFMSPKP